MAQPLIKFFRVATRPATGVPGALYFVSSEGVLYVCTSQTSFEAYAGIKAAALNGSVLTLTPSVGDAISVDIAALAQGAIDLSGYVEKKQTIAGINLQDNITAEELRDALGLTTAEENVLEGVKVNGEELTIAADKTVDILVAEGATNGTIAVNGKDVAVHGLGSAAYKSEDYFVKSEGYVAYSEAEKNKLAGIEAGAEVNIIETVKVNGVALIPDADRAVDVIIPDAAVKGVKVNDKVLALDPTDGMLSTTISMEYKSTSAGGDGYIYLKGIDGAELGKIDAAEFVKDGMIDSVVMGENNVLTITWNTASGKTEATTIDFSKYIDTFTHYGAANGIKIENDKYVGVVDSTSETFLTVGEGGFKLSGVQTAINTAAAEATTVVVEGTDAGNNLTIDESTAADGHSIYTVNLTDVASAKDLSDLTAVVNDNEHVTSAALNDLHGRLTVAEGKLESGVGVMSVTKGTEEGDLVTTVIGGTEADPTVAVAATDALKTAVTAAGSAVQTVTGDAYVTASKEGTTVTITTQVENGVVENSTKLVTSGDVYSALCWQENSF